MTRSLRTALVGLFLASGGAYAADRPGDLAPIGALDRCLSGGDVTRVLGFAAGTTIPTTAERGRADVSGKTGNPDGAINGFDILRIVDGALGRYDKIPTPPCLAGCIEPAGFPYQQTESKCDGVDNDCNGLIDEVAGCDTCPGHCDDGLECTANACDFTSKTCSNPILTSFCVIAGACVPAGEPHPADPCRLCDPAVSPTAWSPAEEGIPCADDNLVCTSDTCTAGVCLHSPNAALCADGVFCTDDVCNAVLGCQNPPKTCSDGVACTFDTCFPSGCVNIIAHSACNDGTACTIDTCTASGCVNAPKPACDDGLTCTVDDCNPATGDCRYTPVANQCVIDGACVPGGTSHPTNPCLRCSPEVSTTTWTALDDGTACTDDQNTCTHDVCGAGLCLHTSHTLACDDGLACTTGDQCAAGTCAGAPVVCAADQSCLASTGTCVPNLEARLIVSLGDVTALGGQAITGYQLVVNFPSAKYDRATPVFTRLAPFGSATVTPNTAQVGRTILAGALALPGITAGAGAEVVRLNLKPKVASNTLSLGDFTVISTTLSRADSQTFAHTFRLRLELCQNGVCTCLPWCGSAVCGDDTCGGSCGSCSGAFQCNGGQCQCQPGSCDDGLACTTDTCGADGLCRFDPVAGTCAIGGACVAAGTANPLNPCQRCESGGKAWSALSNGSPCPADGNNCTADVCTSGTCTHTNSTGSCDDGSACTTSDACAGGTCQGTASTCPSGQTCNPTTGLCAANLEARLYFSAGDVSALAGQKATGLQAVATFPTAKYDRITPASTRLGPLTTASMTLNTAIAGRTAFACVTALPGFTPQAGDDLVRLNLAAKPGATSLSLADFAVAGQVMTRADGMTLTHDFRKRLELCTAAGCDCVAQCAGRECGSDTCGSTCGECASNELCEAGTCLCQPACDGQVCGPDGCGGTCGTCTGAESCSAGLCSATSETVWLFVTLSGGGASLIAAQLAISFPTSKLTWTSPATRLAPIATWTVSANVDPDAPNRLLVAGFGPDQPFPSGREVLALRFTRLPGQPPPVAADFATSGLRLIDTNYAVPSPLTSALRLSVEAP